LPHIFENFALQFTEKRLEEGGVGGEYSTLANLGSLRISNL